ncbi:MAG: N-6 DNA methylase, partial [Candidatus Lokiarchaeota archaeon]|nr:N-6 DNA methylase [Candidatus Lokiarchaeota archaeon]
MCDKKPFDEFKISYTNIQKIESILLRQNIKNKVQYKVWENDYRKVYNSNELNLHLYILHSVLYFLAQLFLSRYVLEDRPVPSCKNTSLQFFRKIQIEIKTQFPNKEIFDFDYFSPYFELHAEDQKYFVRLVGKLASSFFNLPIKNEYKFDYLIQSILSSSMRHKSGEFYTPPFLVQKMVKFGYKFGEKTIDPCCGTGNFLITIFKKILRSKNTMSEKINALNNIYGCDINQLSIFLTKINLLYLITSHITPSKFKLNIFNIDSLFFAENDGIAKEYLTAHSNQFDLVIGNPPWYTYRDLELLNAQKNVKKLAKKFKIKPSSKNILNIEISSLFFYAAREYFLQKEGKIFFVITKGVITGSHASRFRNFRGFKNIKIWMFDQKINNIFNIDFICLFAQKSNNLAYKSNLEIPVFLYTTNAKLNNIYLDNKITLILQKKEIFIPYSVIQKGDKVFTKKLIPKLESSKLLADGESYYKKCFHKGADLNPRSLIFVIKEILTDKLIKINPDDRVFKRAKKPWDKKFYKNNTVEGQYIFK